MATQQWKWIGQVICCFAGVANCACAQSLERFTFTEPHLGTIVALTIYAPEETVANEAARAAYARVKTLDQIFSDYKSDSEAMLLCQQAGSGKAVAVSSELFQLLKQSIAISEQSEGAFDVTVGPLVKLWRRARKEKVLPTADAIAAAKELVGWKQMQLDESAQTVKLIKPGMQLDFGGIAKGYIAQDVARVLRERGLTQTLVAVGGDIAAGDAPPNAAGWKVGVAPLDKPNGNVSRYLQLKNQAISTSGDAFQFAEIGGVRYSHIVDPQTGIGLTHRSSVTVISKDGAMADALATAVCVLGSERGLRLIEGQTSVDVLIVQASGERIRTVESKSFHRYETQESLR